MPLTEADREAARELGRRLAPPTPAEGAQMRAIWVTDAQVPDQAHVA